jgi:hypothetical protein
VRWAAAAKLLPAGTKLVRYGPREATYEEHKPVDVAIRVHPDVGPLPPGLSPRARIVPVDSTQAVASAALSPRLGQPRLFEAQVRDLAPGKYRVEIDLPPELQKHALSSKNDAVFTVAPPSDSETTERAVDWQLLNNLARESGGEFFTIETAERLLDVLERRMTTERIHEELLPWRDQPAVWWLLAGILALLTIEWVTRKLAGLP